MYINILYAFTITKSREQLCNMYINVNLFYFQNANQFHVTRTFWNKHGWSKKQKNYIHWIEGDFVDRCIDRGWSRQFTLQEALKADFRATLSAKRMINYPRGALAHPPRFYQTAYVLATIQPPWLPILRFKINLRGWIVEHVDSYTTVSFVLNPFALWYHNCDVTYKSNLALITICNVSIYFVCLNVAENYEARSWVAVEQKFDSEE